MNNVIKRTTTKIIYKSLVDSSGGRAGDVFKAIKTPYGWTTTNARTGKNYTTFISHLRNENYTYIIKQI